MPPTDRTDDRTAGRRDYRLSGALTARLLGVAVAGLGALLIVLVVLVGALSLPRPVLTVGVLVIAAAVVVAGLVAVRRGYVVRLDRDGYVVRHVRGAGTTAARWTDVEDVVATLVAGERCVVLRLRDGRSTTIPVRMLSARTEDFVTDLQAHLNRGHGYRRIR
ncbi:MAG TPA: hypothetical protein VFM50_03635 [Nocardioidaceae bacterium]|nr:hypothetical protein [Nocardioidaceae bacterium]